MEAVRLGVTFSPLTSVLSFQKQKSHASKNKGKKRPENMKENFLLNSRKTQIKKIIVINKIYF